MAGGQEVPSAVILQLVAQIGEIDSRHLFSLPNQPKCSFDQSAFSA
jgi:hypothetical protein